MDCGKLALGVSLACAFLWNSVMLGSAQSPQGQQAGEVQTGPISEPIGAQKKPDPAIPKGAHAITQKHAKCSNQLIVNADALFGPGRWTLNSDATQTLDALGPLIVQAGKHPTRIVAFTRSDNSDKNNQIVAEKRAMTLTTWLRDKGLVPNDTESKGFGTAPPEGKAPRERVEILIDTCEQPPAPKG